jgi:hypothetical protein
MRLLALDRLLTFLLSIVVVEESLVSNALLFTNI